MGLISDLKNNKVTPKVENQAPTTIKTITGDISVSSQCRILIYRWTNENLTIKGATTNDLASTIKMDVSALVTSVSFSKSLSDPAGTFSFTLANWDDFKEFIKPGMWCTIYLSQDGDLNPEKTVVFGVKEVPPPSKIRCAGYIERVAVKAITTDNGAYDATFEISGRDFGVVYEESAMWFNVMYVEKTMLDALKIAVLPIAGTKPVNELLKTLHDLFYYPNNLKLGLQLDEDRSLTGLAKQWLLPTALVKDLGMEFNVLPYFGNIKNVLNFEASLATVPISNYLDYLNGNVWARLKELSIPEFHELFAEMDLNGQMKLNFRPIPWAIDKSKYPVLGKVIKYFKDLPRIKIDAMNTIDINLGEDNHNRKNHFLTTVVTSMYAAEDNINTLAGSRFPLQIKDSVRRHGFRPMHVDVNSITLNELLGDGTKDRSKLIEFNEVLYDYWNNSVFFESGSLEKIGSNNVRVGLALQFEDDVPYVASKVFYIESYSDFYNIDEKGAGIWTQELKLSHGAEEKKFNDRTGFSYRNEPYKKPGDFTENGK